jgi:hypothetical protein
VKLWLLSTGSFLNSSKDHVLQFLIFNSPPSSFYQSPLLPTLLPWVFFVTLQLPLVTTSIAAGAVASAASSLLTPLPQPFAAVTALL